MVALLCRYTLQKQCTPKFHLLVENGVIIRPSMDEDDCLPRINAVDKALELCVGHGKIMLIQYSSGYEVRRARRHGPRTEGDWFGKNNVSPREDEESRRVKLPWHRASRACVVWACGCAVFLL